MKKIILIFTLMYNAFCMGQCIDKIDSVTIDSDTSHLFQHHKNGKIDTFELEKPKGGSGTTTLYGNEEPVYHRKKDTVMVMILGTDTTKIKKGYTYENGKRVYGNYYEPAFWQYGYSVRELHSTAEEFDSGMTPKELWGTWWEQISYLDENKIPLSKSIIIWDEKEIQ